MSYAILTKVFGFEAAHNLPYHEGHCSRPHGHSYKLEVTLRGAIKHAPGETDHGMVMDFADLARLVKESVIGRLDHTNLNEATEIYTTAEHLAHWIWSALVGAGLSEELLYRLRLWETASSYVEITRAERGPAR